MLCNARQHFGANFVAIMEGENIIRPAISDESFVRTGLSFNLPAEPSSAERRRLALTDGHWLMPQSGWKY